jgi:hypothetical protein
MNCEPSAPLDAFNRMSGSPAKTAPCLGFLTVIEQAELGLLGGYLLLNAAGRPLEFHCTAPVKANRTQQILYGPTLEPYLYGEQIGQTLLARSQLAPLVVCTDLTAVLAAREHVAFPMVRVLANDVPREGTEAHAITPFELAASRVVAASGFAADSERIRAAWPAQADHLDLREPFVRIREALEEAQKSTRQAA